MAPLSPPNVDAATNNGMIHDITPKVRSENVCKKTVSSISKHAKYSTYLTYLTRLIQNMEILYKLFFAQNIAKINKGDLIFTSHI